MKAFCDFRRLEHRPTDNNGHGRHAKNGPKADQTDISDSQPGVASFGDRQHDEPGRSGRAVQQTNEKGFQGKSLGVYVGMRAFGMVGHIGRVTVHVHV